jgi:ATPase subunit of ABC transporter with duplicated ATPase domains
VALLPPVPLLLLDEPFAALDQDGVHWLEGRLRGRTGATVLTLHDGQLASRLAPRILRLDGGRLA